jgi:hypothetical protein
MVSGFAARCVAVLLVACLCTACGSADQGGTSIAWDDQGASSSSNPGSGTKPPLTISSQPAAPGSATPEMSGTVTVPRPVGAVECTPRELRVSVSTATEAGAHATVLVLLVNHSGRACEVPGRASVTLTQSHGGSYTARPIGDIPLFKAAPATRSRRLPPGTSAVFGIYGPDVPGYHANACPGVTQFRISFPGWGSRALFLGGRVNPVHSLFPRYNLFPRCGEVGVTPIAFKSDIVRPS